MKKILVMILALFLLICAAAGYVYTNFNVDNILAGFTEVKTNTYEWIITGDTAYITGIGTLQDPEIVIPSQVYLSGLDGAYVEDPLQGDLYQVCVTGDAFVQCSTIQSVTFEDGVTVENNCMSNGQTGMFSGCKNLISVHNIPDSVTSMAYTFSECASLKEVDQIPCSVVDLTQCFYACSALEISPAIPQSVTAISECFFDCISLHTVGKISAAAADFTNVFYNCQSLKTAPELPNSVQTMRGCF